MARYIPQQENPHAINPERGYLQSANQRAADGTYPYFIPGSYITARGVRIDKKLATMSAITPKDMMELHADYFNVSAEDVRPILLATIQETQLEAKERAYLEILRNWDLKASPDSKGQTVFQCFWDTVQASIWRDEISRTNQWLHGPQSKLQSNGYLRIQFISLQMISIPHKKRRFR